MNIKKALDYAYAAVMFIAIALLWQFAPGWFHIPRFIIVPLSEVVTEIGMDWNDGLGWATYVTFYEMIVGLLFAFIFGFLLAIVLSASETLRKALYPVLIASQSIPVMIIAPVFAIALGYGLEPKIIVVAISCFFPITVNFLGGLTAVDAEQTNLMKTLYGSPFSILTKLRIPSALPELFAGLKVSVAYAPVAALFSEYTGSQGGLGYLMIQAIPQMNTALVWGEVLIIAVLSILFFAIVSLVQLFVCPWNTHR
ncbi:ABC transporter permease [Bifidobacterium breve]|uniref:ABC transporter permease n=1 Tax=Bifidobacterium breve TaxID=1685 RepID=UPI003566DCA2